MSQYVKTKLEMIKIDFMHEKGYNVL